MNDGLPADLHVHLDVRDCSALFLQLRLQLVVRCVLLKKLYRASLPSLQVQELCHELDLLVLARELNLVALQYGRLLLHFNHESVHAFLQDPRDLCLYLLGRGLNLLELALYDLDLVHDEHLLGFESLIIFLNLILRNVVGGLNLDQLMVSPVVALGHAREDAL
jgi:hypothetical protein